MSINKVILLGRVGKDPEIRTVGETKVSNFTFATSEKYKNKAGELIESTEWHNIVIWRGLAEVVEKHVKKGDLLYLEGKIKNSSYDDKEGNKRYRTDIVCDTLQMLGGKQSENNSQPVNKDANQQESNYKNSDLPF